ncbi:MAG: bifunctional glutamate N-acetyltransferase/amino-acid acetyltransferase ArgJ [Kiritimatiellia bacterium]
MHIEKISKPETLELPKNFRAAGISAGIKKAGVKDMALIVSDAGAVMAGTFTTNQVCAAPVKLCKKHLEGGKGRAIIVNSGVANACTGPEGMKAAQDMAAQTARLLGVPETQIFVCSTGIIGKQLPMDVIGRGIEKVVPAAKAEGVHQAVEAIMTTDTRPKHCTLHIKVDGKPVTVMGMAKGAGMIEPNMATMLAFILTDAAVDAEALQVCLLDAVKKSFNLVSVDGDRSTNDTVLCMANGAAGNQPLSPAHKDWEAFSDALHGVAFDLAMKIIGDGEGARKVVKIEVRGALNDAEADIAARAVANSMLVKTSWVKNSPNWGRVMDALGYSRAKVDENLVDIDYDDLPAVRGGMSSGSSPDELKRIVGSECFAIKIDLHLGNGRAEVYSCDCTEEYVQINW